MQDPKTLAAKRMKNSYQVTVIFASGPPLDDVALRSSDIKTAIEVVQAKCEERWPNDKPTFAVKRISDAECEAILEGGGVDWATR